MRTTLFSIFITFILAVGCQNKPPKEEPIKRFIPTYVELSKVINENPDSAEAYYNRGYLVYAYECEFDLDSPYQDEDESEKEWDSISEDAALADFDRAIELNSNYAQAYALRGNVYLYKAIYTDGYEQGYDNAYRDFRKAIAIDVKCKEAYFGMGDYYKEKEEYDEAVSCYSKAIELDNDYLFAYKRRATVYSFMEGKEANELSDYTRILQLSPDHYGFYGERGRLYFDDKEYKKALSDFTKSIELDKDCVLAVYNYCDRAEVYDRMGNKKAALDDYAKAIDVAESQKKQGIAYSGRAEFYLSHQNYKAAIDDYTKAIECKPDNYLNYYQRAEAYAAIGEKQKAIQDFEKVLTMEVDRAEIFDAKAAATNMIKKLSK